MAIPERLELEADGRFRVGRSGIICPMACERPAASGRLTVVGDRPKSLEICFQVLEIVQSDLKLIFNSMKEFWLREIQRKIIITIK